MCSVIPVKALLIIVLYRQVKCYVFTTHVFVHTYNARNNIEMKCVIVSLAIYIVVFILF